MQALSGAPFADTSDSEEETEHGFGDVGSEWGADIEVAPEDEAAVAAFLNPGAERQKTLADIILDKIREKEARDARGGAG